MRPWADLAGVLTAVRILAVFSPRANCRMSEMENDDLQAISHSFLASFFGCMVMMDK